MKILIYGAGVIGSVFAGKLASGGHDVTILARNDRLKALQDDGLRLKDISKKELEQYTVKVIADLAPNDIYEYVLVAVQYRQIGDILPKLAENKSESIIVVVNNPNGYGQWKEYLGQKLMTGFPAFGGETQNNITEYYISKGFSRLFQTTTFGEPDGSVTKRLKTIVKIFTSCGIPSVISRRIENWQKCHLPVVLPIAGSILKNNGSVKALSSHRSDIKQILRATRQGFSALKELGIKVEPKKLNFYKMPISLLCFMFSIVFRAKIAEFSMEKHTNNAKAEMGALALAFNELIKDTKTDKRDILALSSDIKS